jgi:hypothetical protein
LAPRSYELNYTQELRGLGIANIVGALFQCYTTTGSFSRSAVNNSVGCVPGWLPFLSFAWLDSRLLGRLAWLPCLAALHVAAACGVSPLCCCCSTPKATRLPAASAGQGFKPSAC